jgi:transcription elongation factor SPT6
MSSSIRRSSREELEETDEMNVEPMTKTERDNDYNLSDSEEAEDTDERANNYEYDDFVVPDDYDDGTDEIPGTDTESKKRKKRKRRVKDYSLDKEDTDLIDENLGTSTDRYRRLKKARKNDTEDDDILDEEEASLSSSYHKERLDQTMDNLKLINHIFSKDTEGDENDRIQIEDDTDMMDEKRNDLNGFFHPEEIEERFQTDRDRHIVEKDEPERLQLRFAGRPMPDNPELIEETNWLVEKITLKNNITTRDAANLKNKVHKVLEYLRLASCEIMYIWVHKKHEITSDKRLPTEDKGEYDLKLADLWYIYDLDLEWMQIFQRRKHVMALMTKLDGHFSVSSNLKNSFRSCYDLGQLSYYMNYYEYQLKKYIDEQEIVQLLTQDNQDHDFKEPQFKRMKKRNFAKEVMKYNLHDVANQISITPDQMAENLMAGDQKYKPRIVNDTPDKIANEYSNSSVQMIQMPVETLTTLCDFMALELFYHPIIRKQLKKMYNDRVLVSTDPTEKGKKEINVYSFYYPCKRIRAKKPADFTKEHWLMILEAEQKGLITTEFKMPWDKDEKRDEIRKKLLDYYLLEIKSRKSEDQELTTVNAWNIVREETISKLLKHYLYPSLEQSLREELKDVSEKFVISECAKYFRDIINIQPYRRTSELGESISEQSRLKVLACISEAATSKCYFVLADENGELLEHMVLDYIGRNPGDDMSMRTIYNQERTMLKNLMCRIYPDVIVMGATNLNCQQIKLELDNISKEVVEEAKEISPNTELYRPFVMWGISSVPNAWAKTFQAKNKFPELPAELREALSMCRVVQDPLVETLNLWNERIKDNVLLSLNYHVMQHMVSPVKLKSEFEKIAMEVCNNVGVDINRVVKYRHLSSPLQFICGLGPRKAAHLIEKINYEVGPVKTRREIFDSTMQKTVYINAIGFIKILEDSVGNDEETTGVYDRLDTSRIHPDYYQLAVKIAREALDDKGVNDRIDYVRKVMENPKRLGDLDLEDYAKHLNQKSKNNSMSLIEFIVHELTHPFQDPRAEFKTKLKSDELFYKLTKESKYTLREEAIITVRITRIDGKAIRVVTDSGVPGIIPLQDLKDKHSEIKEGDISRFYSVGEYLKAKVRNINFNLVRLKLSTKPEDLLDHSEFIRKSKVLENFNLNDKQNFQVEKSEDFPTFSQDKHKKSSRYTPRRINHPKFKNISLSTAQEYLGEREVGDFVIRPSGQGLDHLNITWKLSNDNIVHLDIVEGIKGPNDMISKHLTLDKETYESLDEIIERYIKPCNIIVSQIREHKKFMDEPLDFVKETLLQEKNNDQTFIPYYMSFVPEAPQLLILSYIPRYFDVQHEYIKIKPDGLMFHDTKFAGIKKLIAWFKTALKTPEYQKYIEHITPLPFDLNSDKRRIKDEAYIKKEGRDPKREKKKEKDSVYKQRPIDNVRRRRPRDADEENKLRRKSNSGWGREDWDDQGENKEWAQEWDANAKYSRDKGRIRLNS